MNNSDRDFHEGAEAFRAIKHIGFLEDHEPVIFDGFPVIPNEVVPRLVDFATGFICEMIQTYIDAGSEREVTIEDEALNLALTNAFKEWSLEAAQNS